MESVNYISVSGFSASGSSAVVDLLKEFSGVYECNAEIRLIQDPYGIRQLERNLVDDWNYLTSSAALNDYLWLANKCSRSGGGRFPLSRAGLSYSKTICKDFMKITNEYVQKLSRYSYHGDYYYLKFKKPYIKYVFDRCLLGFDMLLKGKLHLSSSIGKKLYFSTPTREEFEAATKAYFDALFADHFDENGNGCVILDQAISVSDPDAIDRYFRNGKMIIVDRDPRDMYVDDIVNWGGGFSDDVASAKMGEQYVLKHKAMHRSICESDKVLYLRFEDVVCDYENSVRRICDFLGFSIEDHVKQRTFLIPEQSAKNVGIWRQHYEKFKDAIDVIEEKLTEYCRAD